MQWGAALQWMHWRCGCAVDPVRQPTSQRQHHSTAPTPPSCACGHGWGQGEMALSTTVLPCLATSQGCPPPASHRSSTDKHEHLALPGTEREENARGFFDSVFELVANDMATKATRAKPPKGQFPFQPSYSRLSRPLSRALASEKHPHETRRAMTGSHKGQTRCRARDGAFPSSI